MDANGRMGEPGASSLMLHFQFMNYVSQKVMYNSALSQYHLLVVPTTTSNAKVFICSFLVLQLFKVTVSTVHMIILRCEVREAKLVKQLVNLVAVS